MKLRTLLTLALLLTSSLSWAGPEILMLGTNFCANTGVVVESDSADTYDLLSGWTITGATPCARLTYSADSGDAIDALWSIAVYNGASMVAYGSGSYGSTITLATLGQGISGSVVAATTDVEPVWSGGLVLR